MNSVSSFTPEQWVHNYADALYRYALVRVNDSGLAEDLVQETFLSAWKNKDSFKGDASEKNWLYTICKNKIIDQYRKKANNIVQSAEFDTSAEYFDEHEHWTKESGPLDWGVDYAQSIEKKEFYSILSLCKQKLQQLQQSVFVLKFMEGLETEEICKVLNITPTNYWVLIHRAKLQLRSCLEKNWINS